MTPTANRLTWREVLRWAVWLTYGAVMGLCAGALAVVLIAGLGIYF